MTQLTREEWGEVAEILGDEAGDFEETIGAIEEILEEFPHENVTVREYDLEILARTKRRAKAFRDAAAAVLWVSENAAEKVRFVMLDSHTPDGV